MTLRLRPLSIRTRLTLWYGGVLLGILVVFSMVGYSVLHFGLIQDLDASLLTVAQVLRDAKVSAEGPGSEAEVETLLRELLGAEFYAKFFRFLDPQGRPAPPPSRPGSQGLLLSPEARANAIRGRETFETVKIAGSDEDVRLLTVPIVRNGQLARIVQVGMSFQRADAALRRYVRTLVVLIPLGVALATVGGALIARTAQRLGHSCRPMTSGAGHDAQMMARMCPTAMIFVPSVKGISHNPAEHTDDTDLEAGANVLLECVLRLATR